MTLDLVMDGLIYCSGLAEWGFCGTGKANQHQSSNTQGRVSTKPCLFSFDYQRISWYMAWKNYLSYIKL